MGDEIEKIGDFNLYDRVRIKQTNITGNIVFIHDENDCEVELDDKFVEGDNITKTCDVNELEHE